MIVFDNNNMNCILFFSKQTKSPKLYWIMFGSIIIFDENKTKYKMEDLDEVDRSIYIYRYKVKLILNYMYLTILIKRM